MTDFDCRCRHRFQCALGCIDNISNCLPRQRTRDFGTTGWLEHYDEMAALCKEKNGGFISSSNFSLGVNLFFELNEYLAKMMSTNSKVTKSTWRKSTIPKNWMPQWNGHFFGKRRD